MQLGEIATTLGISLGTVKSSLHRAIGRLRPKLAGLRT
jgi:DNA-directed RNA polymerase specialized sigma24 family protein